MRNCSTQRRTSLLYCTCLGSNTVRGRWRDQLQVRQEAQTGDGVRPRLGRPLQRPNVSCASTVAGSSRAVSPHLRRRHKQGAPDTAPSTDRKSTRLNSSHVAISYAVFCLKKERET